MISGNSVDGVEIFGIGTSGNLVEGDYIGITASGSSGLANGGNGVLPSRGASNNTIGGTPAGNVVSGNTGRRVSLRLGDVRQRCRGRLHRHRLERIESPARRGRGGDPERRHQQYNRRDHFDRTRRHLGQRWRWRPHRRRRDERQRGRGGLHRGDRQRLRALGNGASGVAIYAGAGYNTIGGTVAGSRDVLAGNYANGVCISDMGTSHNVVEGDYIGTDSTGSSAVGNGIGVLVQNGATFTTIGGTTAAARNVISGNSDDGIVLTGSGTSQNQIEGCYISADASGKSALGNRNDGIVIASGASSSNFIGNGSAGADLIEYNGQNGVEFDGTITSGNEIEFCTINDNGANGVFLNGASQNYVIGCTIESNQRWGILDQGSNNTYGYNTIASNGSGNIGT